MPPQQSQLHCIEHDLEVVQLADERDAALFQRLMHPRIASCSSQEDDPLPEVRRPGHESVVEIESVDLGHQEVAHHRGNARIGRDHLQGPRPESASKTVSPARSKSFRSALLMELSSSTSRTVGMPLPGKVVRRILAQTSRLCNGERVQRLALRAQIDPGDDDRVDSPPR